MTLTMTAPKWACLHVVVAFASSPSSHETQGCIDYLCSHHDQNCLGVGHGGDNQQQHIPVVAFYPQNLEVYLHKCEVWDACTPILSSSNNQPRGWISRVSSLQN